MQFSMLLPALKPNGLRALVADCRTAVGDLLPTPALLAEYLVGLVLEGYEPRLQRVSSR